MHQIPVPPRSAHVYNTLPNLPFRTPPSRRTWDRMIRAKCLVPSSIGKEQGHTFPGLLVNAPDIMAWGLEHIPSHKNGLWFFHGTWVGEISIHHLFYVYHFRCYLCHMTSCLGITQLRIPWHARTVWKKTLLTSNQKTPLPFCKPVFNRLGPQLEQKSGQETHTPSGVEICRHFNNSRCSVNENCRYAHTCWVKGCNGTHPAKGCPLKHSPQWTLTDHTFTTLFVWERVSKPSWQGWVSWLTSSIRNGVHIGYAWSRCSLRAKNLHSAYFAPWCYSGRTYQGMGDRPYGWPLPDSLHPQHQMCWLSCCAKERGQVVHDHAPLWHPEVTASMMPFPRNVVPCNTHPWVMLSLYCSRQEGGCWWPRSICLLQSGEQIGGSLVLSGTIKSKCLLFGLRSAPYLFNQVAQALSWLMSNIKSHIHHLDDYFLVGSVASDQCATQVLNLCTRLEIPVATDKLEGFATAITFLGIQINIARQELSLPADKLSDLVLLIEEWCQKTKCTKWQLLSLIGKLAFAAKVAPAGRLLDLLWDCTTTFISILTLGLVVWLPAHGSHPWEPQRSGRCEQNDTVSQSLPTGRSRTYTRTNARPSSSQSNKTHGLPPTTSSGEQHSQSIQFKDKSFPALLPAAAPPLSPSIKTHSMPSHSRSVSYPTIKYYLAAIAYQHKRWGFPNPTTSNPVKNCRHPESEGQEPHAGQIVQEITPVKATDRPWFAQQWLLPFTVALEWANFLGQCTLRMQLFGSTTYQLCQNQSSFTFGSRRRISSAKGSTMPHAPERLMRAYLALRQDPPSMPLFQFTANLSEFCQAAEIVDPLLWS